MKATAADLLATLPRPASTRWPGGVPFAEAFRHGSMVVELYAPRGRDLQAPHSRDELYFIVRGSGDFIRGDSRHRFGPGDTFFVPAGLEHRFENFTGDFSTWVVFYGPEGGERP